MVVVAVILLQSKHYFKIQVTDFNVNRVRCFKCTAVMDLKYIRNMSCNNFSLEFLEFAVHYFLGSWGSHCSFQRQKDFAIWWLQSSASPATSSQTPITEISTQGKIHQGCAWCKAKGHNLQLAKVHNGNRSHWC